MTKDEASRAMNEQLKVCGGEREDYDEGYVLALGESDAEVGWDSGTRTWCPLADLALLKAERAE